jgi:enoyl-CoA hydratase/carnithine racemase
MYDIQCKLKANVGVVRMNKEHRFNTLTPAFVEQVTRGVETMYLDHSIALIYLAPAEGQHFSNGTDFRTMLHYKSEGKDEKLASYVEDIYKL